VTGRQVQTLRKMMTALSFSLLPMMNAFFIILVIASICDPAPPPPRPPARS
jgi:hypothetical protein